MTTAIEQPEVVTLLENIATLLRKQNMDKRVWDFDDIAEFTNLSKSTVQSALVKQAGFPCPRRLPTGGKRWEPKEIKAWWERQPRDVGL